MPVTKKFPDILLSALTAAAFIWSCFSANVMEQFVHLHSAADIFGCIMRWISMAGFIALPAALLYRQRHCRTVCLLAVLPATLIGLALSAPFFAVYPLSVQEKAAYITSNAAILASCTYLLYRDGLPPLRELPRAALLLALLLIGVFPLNIFMQAKPLMTARALLFRNFGPWHIVFVVMLILSAIGLFYLLRGKNTRTRTISLFLLSLSLAFQLCTRFSFVRLQDYQTAHGLVGAMPLYVCSFGIMLLPFAILSGSAFFRGALFMVNCPGAIIAFVWPDTGPVTILHYNVTYFVFSHILLFVTTAHLAILLNGAPQKAHLLHLSYAIVAYYLLMVLLNAVAVKFGGGYDPNFSFVAKSPLPLPLHELLPVQIGFIRFSPPYIAVLCAVQFALCALTFGAYRLGSRLLQKQVHT